MGRFVNGDYYVVGEATILGICPEPTHTNGRHGSMIKIRPNVQRSGFDSRIAAKRYDASLRAYPPITLTPGNQLMSSRSIGDTYAPRAMRPHSKSESPVASVSILTSVAAPWPPEVFRPSYAGGTARLYIEGSVLPFTGKRPLEIENEAFAQPVLMTNQYNASNFGLAHVEPPRLHDGIEDG